LCMCSLVRCRLPAIRVRAHYSAFFVWWMREQQIAHCNDGNHRSRDCRIARDAARGRTAHGTHCGMRDLLVRTRRSSFRHDIARSLQHASFRQSKLLSSLVRHGALGSPLALLVNDRRAMYATRRPQCSDAL
jgi:hypothetical protein